METIERGLAKVLTYVLHPLFMPSYGALLFFIIPSYISFTLPYKHKLFIALIVFIGTFLIPFLASLVLLSKGYIKSLTVGTREHRHGPYILTLISYAACYYLMLRLGLPQPLLLMLLGITISVLVVFLINLKWKVSAHMCGIGGIVGALAGFSLRVQVDLLPIILLLLLISGLLGFARIKLNAHTPAQVYIGFLLGFCIEFILLLYF